MTISYINHACARSNISTIAHTHIYTRTYTPMYARMHILTHSLQYCINARNTHDVDRTHSMYKRLHTHTHANVYTPHAYARIHTHARAHTYRMVPTCASVTIPAISTSISLSTLAASYSRSPGYSFVTVSTCWVMVIRRGIIKEGGLYGLNRIHLGVPGV